MIRSRVIASVPLPEDVDYRLEAWQKTHPDLKVIGAQCFMRRSGWETIDVLVFYEEPPKTERRIDTSDVDALLPPTTNDTLIVGGHSVFGK